MTYLVTGGAGFIGSHVVDELLNLGHKVLVIDDFSLGKKENLAQHQDNKNLVVYKKSICSRLTEIFQKNPKIDALFHLAALPRVQFSIEHPIKTHKVNVNGTLNLLESCRQFEIKRFIFSSSCAVYGNQEALPFTEEMSPNPLCPYGLHKLVGEYYCRLFYQLYDLETISLRYFNVFGPRLDPQGDYACVIPKFTRLIRQGKSPTINGDGKQTRDFIFVSDVVRANLLAAQTQNKDCFGQVFNIGSGQNLSINEIAQRIIKLSGQKIQPRYGPPVVEPRHTLADTQKAKKLLGWQPKISFESGLKKTYDYFMISKSEYPQKLSLHKI